MEQKILKFSIGFCEFRLSRSVSKQLVSLEDSTYNASIGSMGQTGSLALVVEESKACWWSISVMSAEQPDSVSAWVTRLQGGDAEAAQKLWDRYFEKLLVVAQARIKDCPRAILNAEDIAVSVFESLWRGAQQGRFRKLSDRDELWWLLLALTRQKAANHIRRESAQKRGGGAVPLSLTGMSGARNGFHDLMSDDPTPEFALIMEEEYSRIMGLLRDDRLRQIAVLKLEGYTNQEICQQLEISPATVTRKLGLIRSTWGREFEP